MPKQSVSIHYQALVEESRRILAQRDSGNLIRIQVGSATCEDAAGANEVFDEFRKHIEASGRSDIRLRRTGCTGRCSCEPIVSLLVAGQAPVKYERVNREIVHRIFTQHVMAGKPLTEEVLDVETAGLRKFEFLFCSGARCGRKVLPDLPELLAAKLKTAGVSEQDYCIVHANCFGLCPANHEGNAVHMMVRPWQAIYRLASEADLERVIRQQVVGGQVVQELVVHDQPISQRFFALYGDVAFFHRQSRIALRNSGLIDPEDLYEYVAVKGFEAAAAVLGRNDPQWAIEQVSQAKLRGRGGAGFPTGTKWANASRSPETTRYIICNADEGDPGAFMDRSMLEGDPFSVIEGMIIGGFAIGAHRGFLYVRAEYPMAIRRLENAIELCRKNGLLGKNILGSGYDLDLEIRLGAGAFVCGEETALIHSIEGLRGQPRVRPPFPSEAGLWGKPTVINNVETFTNVPVVFLYGPQWFASLGTPASGGTKVFALAGKVSHTGLVEVPMGTSLRQIVFDVGGGVPGGKKLKAIQTGGPAGGCIPAQFLDTPVDFDTLGKLGSIMGSGGMIVMDEDDCMVDIAKFFLGFTADESCGKCTPCREGTRRMLEIVERITEGKGVIEDLEKLERLGKLIRKSSLCGLGRAAPNPVLSTLKYFRHEYEAHIHQRHCAAGRCAALLRYTVVVDKCVGCTACARKCPAACITGSSKKVHQIDQQRCIRCGACFKACRFDAIARA
ncbi:MAG: NADH-quinone oxidoreductase subunit NuoF [Planctomycetaceae bacterium]|nr:NADH-quinone oxidoreductase subunit NuoF [Planctomycetaceae bacterium]